MGRAKIFIYIIIFRNSTYDITHFDVDALPHAGNVRNYRCLVAFSYGVTAELALLERNLKHSS